MAAPSTYDLRRAFTLTVPEADARHESPVMDVAETAEYLGRSENWVRRFLRYEIPVVQYARRGRIYFEKRDVDVWLAEHRQAPAR